jgi:hypothetical protein
MGSFTDFSTLAAAFAVTALFAGVTAQDPARDPTKNRLPDAPRMSAEQDGKSSESVHALRRMHDEFRQQVVAKLEDAAKEKGMLLRDGGAMFTSVGERMIAAAPTVGGGTEAADTLGSGNSSGRSSTGNASGGGTAGTGSTGAGTTTPGTTTPGTTATGTGLFAPTGSPLGILVIAGPATTLEPASADGGGPPRGKLRAGCYTIQGTAGSDSIQIVGDDGELVTRVTVPRTMPRSMTPTGGVAGDRERDAIDFPSPRGSTGSTGGTGTTGRTGGGTGPTGASTPTGATGSGLAMTSERTWWKQVYAAILNECLLHEGAPAAR